MRKCINEENSRNKNPRMAGHNEGQKCKDFQGIKLEIFGQLRELNVGIFVSN